MRIVRKDKCDSGPVAMEVHNIRKDTVFSGVPIFPDKVKQIEGVFLKCATGFVRLSYYDSKLNSAFVFNDPEMTIRDYKELNAYLCIEE